MSEAFKWLCLPLSLAALAVPISYYNTTTEVAEIKLEIIKVQVHIEKEKTKQLKIIHAK